MSNAISKYKIHFIIVLCNQNNHLNKQIDRMYCQICCCFLLRPVCFCTLFFRSQFAINHIFTLLYMCSRITPYRTIYRNRPINLFHILVMSGFLTCISKWVNIVLTFILMKFDRFPLFVAQFFISFTTVERKKKKKETNNSNGTRASTTTTAWDFTKGDRTKKVYHKKKHQVKCDLEMVHSTPLEIPSIPSHKIYSIRVCAQFIWLLFHHTSYSLNHFSLPFGWTLSFR